MGKAKRLRAARELAREQHARLVVERSGDPRYVQRQRTPDGYIYELDADSAAAIEAQRERFREKFGRDPAPEDPLFFDPNLDEPTPLDEQTVMRALRKAISDAGLDPAYADAYDQLGFILTEENQHLFSAHEVEAWQDAVTASRRRNDH